MITLVSFSGGLDSHGLAVQLLGTGEKLWFHHFRLLNTTKRNIAEYQSWLAFKQWVLKVAAERVVLSEQVLDMNHLPIIPNDIAIMRFHLAIICSMAPEIKAVAFGRTKDDEEEGQHRTYRKLFNIAKDTSKAELIFPVNTKHKRQLYDSLPVELQQSWWSCRRPVYEPFGVYNCGACTPCRALKHYGIKHPILRREHAEAS